MECKRCLLLYQGSVCVRVRAHACVCVKICAQVSTLQATDMSMNWKHGCQYYAFRQQEVTICIKIEVNTSSISDKMYLRLFMHC